MKKLVVLVLLVGLTVVTSGCYTLNYSNSAGSKPISFTGEVKGQRTHFVDERNQWYAFWGLLPIGNNDVSKVLIEPRAAGGAVQNLSIQSGFTPMDVLISFFTSIATFYRTTITVEGDVVR
jgi:hypothetical protein